MLLVLRSVVPFEVAPTLSQDLPKIPRDYYTLTYAQPGALLTPTLLPFALS